MKLGGDIFSYSEMLAAGNGLAKRTLNRGEENNYMMVISVEVPSTTVFKPE